jgi:threonine dehydrogenase-like Zn-dependent dehydrogenase
VVLGAGPIGVTAAVAARDRGADVMVVDPVASRRLLAGALGFETADRPDPEVLAGDRGPDGPDVVIDTTGRAAAFATAVDVVGHGGRLVVVGLTSESAAISPGPLPIKELDVVGASCCLRDELADAVDLLRRHPPLAESLISHVLPLDEVADGFDLLASRPADACKVLIDLRSSSDDPPPRQISDPGGTAR